MPTTTNIQTNFTAGEISPRLFGRSDLSKYENAAQLLQNFMVMKQGGAMKRSGTKYVANSNDQSNASRLYPFAFSTDQTYVFEFVNLKVFIYRNFTSGSTPRILTVNAVEGGTAIELATPYTTAQLDDLKFTQSADVMVVTHPSHAPRIIARKGVDTTQASWSITPYVLQEGPWNDTPIDQTITVTFTGVTNEVTIESPVDIDQWADDATARYSQVWVWEKVDGGARSGAYRIIDNAAGDPPVVVGQEKRKVRAQRLAGGFNETPFEAERLFTGAWNGSDGWPECASFHNNRLFWGANTTYPQRVWASFLGIYYLHRPVDLLNQVQENSPAEEYGFEFEPGDTQVDKIEWLESDSAGLVIPTSGGMYIANGGQAGVAMNQSNVSVRKQNNRGASSTVRPTKVGDTLVYTDASSLKVRSFNFDFDTDRFVSPDLNALAEHITVGGITDVAYSAEPNSIIWYLRSDGVLLGLTYERLEEVVAWHKHVIGTDSTGDGVVEAIASIRNGTADQLWLSVKRTVNSATVRYIEVLDPDFAIGADKEDAFFVDSGYKYDGSAEATIPPGGSPTELNHLAGETVTILADGVVVTGKTVTTGGNSTVTLDTAASVVQVGLPYTASLTSVPLVPRSSRNVLARRQRIYKNFLRMYQSQGGAVGDTTSDTFNIEYDDATTLFTGYKEVGMNSTSERDDTLSVVHSTPQPLTVLAVISDMQLDGA